MVACGQWRWLWVVGGSGGGWGFGFAYCSLESSDDQFVVFFFFFCNYFIGVDIFYFIVMFILFYCVES